MHLKKYEDNVFHDVFYIIPVKLIEKNKTVCEYVNYTDCDDFVNQYTFILKGIELHTINVYSYGFQLFVNETK